MLRIFTTSGLQKRIVMLHGPVLCMHGYESQLAVLHHSPCSPGADGSQDVHFQWLDVDMNAIVGSGAVCLSPQAKLEWLQLSETGFLSIMDSSGIVSVYSPPGPRSAGQWSPVLDINSLEKEKKMHKRDWFWPVLIDSENIVGIIVKEEKRYPDSQLPVMTKFPLAMPLIVGASAQEEAFMRSTLFTDRKESIILDEEDRAAVETSRMLLDKSLLQQINAACQQKKLARAFDLAQLFSSEKGLMAATTLANRHRLTNLAERIDTYRQERFREEDEEVEYEDVVEEEAYQEPAAKRSKHSHRLQQPEQQEDDETEDSRQQVRTSSYSAYDVSNGQILGHEYV